MYVYIHTYIPTYVRKYVRMYVCMYVLSSLNAMDLHRAGVLDPEGLKIKSEIHSFKKADIGRWCLIWLGSVRLEVVDRLLHGLQNTVELSLYQANQTHTPDHPYFGSAVGMGHHDEGLDVTAQAMRRLGLSKGTCMDCSQWDLNQSTATIYADGLRRAYLAHTSSAPDSFCRAQLVRSVAMSRHLVQIGEEVHLACPLGIVVSGLFFTAASNSWMNSWMRGFVHSCAFYESDCKRLAAMQPGEAAWLAPRPRPSLTMGDDLACPQIVTPVELEYRHHTGLIMDPDDQDNIESGGGIVYFTSHAYDLVNNRHLFDNFPKMLLRLAISGTTGFTAEQFAGVLFAVRHCPEMSRCIRSLVKDLEEEGCIAAGTLEAADQVDESCVDMAGLL